eukprot:scaffold320_cov122-Cylindrotheca_fusiformis.AAC.3
MPSISAERMKEQMVDQNKIHSFKRSRPTPSSKRMHESRKKIAMSMGSLLPLLLVLHYPKTTLGWTIAGSAYGRSRRSSIRNKQPPLQATPIITTSSKGQQRSHFSEKDRNSQQYWGTMDIANSDDGDNNLPCVETLDPLHGTLPHGCYTYDAPMQYDPKPTCRISLSFPSSSDMDPEVFIPMCQNYIESGFQTFQNASPELIQKFYSQTPSKLIGSIHWAFSYQIPTTIVDKTMIKEQVLSRMLVGPATSSYSDAIDTLILKYNPQSPYHLDVLDICTELQREGWIRSIGIENFPTELQNAALDECNFSVQVIQQDGNLLLPPDNKKKSSSSTQAAIKQWTTNALVGSMLAYDFSDRREPPTMNPQWKTTIRDWGKRQGIVQGSSSRDDDRRLWQAFQKDVLEVLQDMANRYGVSVRSIAIRWALEAEGTSSVVLPAAWSSTANKNWEEFSSMEWKRHIREMRQSFSFRLGKEDQQIVANLARGDQRKVALEEALRQQQQVEFLQKFEEMLIRQGLPEQEIENMLKMQEKQSTLDDSKIDFNNPALWL